MKERASIEQDPSITKMPTEEAVALLMRVYGEDEATARLMVGIATGEIEGDAYGIADDIDMPPLRRPQPGKARAS